MHRLLLIFCSAFLLFFSSCQEKVNHDKKSITRIIDNWHMAAAQANIDSYFGLMSKDAIYIGTDPGERWTKEEFHQFCEPYFSKGKAWDFKPFDRKIYVSEDGKSIWFDELLETWMGICRGSGVIVIEDKQYKISHYHLSVTITNESIKEFLKIKQE